MKKVIDKDWIEKLSPKMTEIRPGVYEGEAPRLSGRDYFRRAADFLHPREAEPDPLALVKPLVGPKP